LPDASIVIVNYRSYDELTNALAAVQSTSLTDPREIAVVDQESDPGAVGALKAQFPGIRLLENPRNNGFAAGVNRGMRETTGRYVLALNPDTVVQPGLFETLASWLDAHADVAVVGPRILNSDGSVQPSARRFPDVTTGLGGRMSLLTKMAPDNWLSQRNLAWSRASEPTEVDWVSGACMMIRRSAFDQVGGFDEGFFLYWEDADLCRRLRTSGYRTFYIPQATAVHEGSRASRHAVKRSIVAFHRSAFRYYWKHGGSIARGMAPIAGAILCGRMLVKLAFAGRTRP
jgi:N-acetylglucosaminyl-diphospho-decaprenol L-rhamnosyltransferase